MTFLGWRYTSVKHFWFSQETLSQCTSSEVFGNDWNAPAIYSSILRLLISYGDSSNTVAVGWNCSDTRKRYRWQCTLLLSMNFDVLWCLLLEILSWIDKVCPHNCTEHISSSWCTPSYKTWYKNSHFSYRRVGLCNDARVGLMMTQAVGFLGSFLSGV